MTPLYPPKLLNPMEKTISRRTAFVWQTIRGSTYFHMFTAAAIITGLFILLSHFGKDGVVLVSLLTAVSMFALGTILSYIIERNIIRERAKARPTERKPIVPTPRNRLPGQRSGEFRLLRPDEVHVS